jgi:hypothetical protein
LVAEAGRRTGFIKISGGIVIVGVRYCAAKALVEAINCRRSMR